ncbi:MAG: type VI secretion system tip protein VgrG [Saprospirales bacterium]|nr:type VI secretion system tip protein VgrG [Saprospirales bacterium]
MPNETNSPQQDVQDIVSFAIFANGSRVQDTHMYVYSIEVEHCINSISKAKFVLLDGDPSTQTFEVKNSDDFSPGVSIKVNVGYQTQTTTIFEGFVIATGVKVKEGTHSQLTVECVGNAYRMTVSRKTRYFMDMDDSDIISDVISSYNSVSMGTVESSSVRHKSLVQYNSSDWDFILMRAEATGMIVNSHDNQVSVNKPRMNESPSLSLEYGRDIIKCDLQADGRYQVKSVEASAWDSSQQQVVTGQSTEATLQMNTQGDNKVSGETMADFVHPLKSIIHSSGPKTQQELNKWANARLLKSRFSRIRGSVTFQGNASVVTDSLVTLGGFGDYFNGDAYVSKVVHKVDLGNWLTEAHIGFTSVPFAEATPNVTVLPAAGLYPGIEGLYNGVVTKIDQDPDGHERIQIKIPVLLNSETLWARMATIYATDQGGVYFLPEIGDEVIVGFIQNDPLYPVILGKLHSQKIKPPFTADNQNSNKGIVTKSKLKLVFEDQKKNILIETPGGQKIWLKDEDKTITIQDSNNNKIVMDNSGIVINSAKDLTLKATGKISLEANQNIALESKGGDVSSAGLNVKIDAKITASVKGSMAELKGTASTEVKGAIVRIN